MTTQDAEVRADFDRRVGSLRGRRVLAVGYWDLTGLGPDENSVTGTTP